MANQLWARKPLSLLLEEMAGENRLRRVPGPVQLSALGVGAIIGTGIFVLTGTVAALNSGPAVVLSFALAGVASIFAALCYSEFASLVPMAGSAYTYGYATLGEVIAWIIGWDLVLEYALGAVTVAIGWSGYFRELLSHFGISMPAWLATDYRSAHMAADAVAGCSTSTKCCSTAPRSRWPGLNRSAQCAGTPSSTADCARS